LVRRAGQLLNRHFSSLWELTEWLERNRPDIDLDTPPRFIR
jgi:hypothetical protein